MCFLKFHRLSYGQSYFDILPPELGDKIVNYSTACRCNVNDNDAKRVCQDAFTAAFPTVMKKKNLSPMFLCDRDKRDVHFSDDPTEEDFQTFKKFPQLQPRLRRAAQLGQISKANATRYCAERISETEIGKMCAKVGVNVQALVNICSADVVVSRQPFSQVTLPSTFVVGIQEMFYKHRNVLLEPLSAFVHTVSGHHTKVYLE